MIYDEAKLQRDIVSWFGLQYPYLEGLLVGYVAGVNVDIKTAVRLKRMGLRAGFPDLQLLVPGSIKDDGTEAPGLFLELKTIRGRLSDIQKEYHSKLRFLNYTIVVVRELDEAISWVKAYLGRVPGLEEKYRHRCLTD
ncbi:VRR-NUC domain containing protein [uncultured Caudovirales phage]|uniref:VRR-NUC domain containing protein n=1 Tax=uncultured Caudovirales phage TaxID=2100421 RepID=A0A6J5LIH6_9CAUD|nr:VRR-NUC domain containing protein [uncultured Caudovirales phage]CAB4133985.1 VRR-NUC domain containing protein [uncultured Caudovirales phage]